MKTLLKIFLLVGISAFVDAKQKCSKIVAECDENEAYNSCGSICNEPKCPRYGFEELVCAAVCVDGCFCADGFVRDPSGNCVHLESCPAVTCPANQHYSDCGAACVPSCETPVLLFCPYICSPGCICDEGFVKNSEGNCVTLEQCPTPTCGENENYLQAGSPCQSTCSHPEVLFCRAASRPGCFCKPGYIRDDNDRCILPEECPMVECHGENEVYTDCGSTCGDLTCEVQSLAAVTCVAGCGKGCYCAEGFVRNGDGICVAPESCPSVGHCSYGEEWNDCGPADGCEASCDSNLFDMYCTAMCVPKCVCEEGNVRDSNGNCIAKESCPTTECGSNEIYTECGSGCGDLTCEMRSLEGVSCPSVCSTGCFCAEGFVRDVSGICISESECPTCPENEIYTQCGAACVGTCSNPFPFICPAICMSGCVCSDGLVRSEDGKCVEVSECPKLDCGVNEHYTDCGSGCGDLTCDLQSFAAVLCPAVCNPGCFCDEGYVRNAENVCVPPKTCPNFGCKVNEVWNDCGPVDYCEATCKNPDLIDMNCPDVCVEKCVCQDGYVRDGYYNCVPKDSCSAVQCGDNEFYTDCGSGCGDLTCDRSDLVNIMCPAVCTVGCFCVEGFVRNSDRICIPLEKCPSTECGANQHYSECGVNGCQNTCEQPELEKVCRNIRCQEGCYCDDGFIRRSDGECVLPEQCQQKCGENSIYSECGIGGCQNTCENPEFAMVCRPAGCSAGCYCTEGYIKNANDECVLPKDCPSSECGANQHYSECGANGCQNTCEQPELQNVCMAMCMSGCICDDGFIRRSDGECVLPESCSTECGANQHFEECGVNGCQNTCEEPELETYCNNIRCQEGCYCDEGFIRRSDGECVLPEQCQQISECGENSIYSECGIGGCQNTCENPEFAMVCRPAGCSAGCYCTEGYIKNANDECVLPEDCPTSECGANQHYEECGVNGCQNTCEQPELEKVCLNKRCQEGCYCDEGFIRRSDGECVLPENCKNQCGSNEIFFPECGPGICENTCEQPDKQLVCKAKCEPGCFCGEGFVRNEEGACVSFDECSSGCGDYEVYNSCGSGCGDLTCDQRSFINVICPDVCVQACFCEEGFVRDSRRRCIPVELCPKPKCETNEEYLECGSPCESTCDHPDPIFCKAKCYPGCFCKKGFVRDNGKCIKPKSCPRMSESGIEEAISFS